ncbi:MAG TPA: class I SAM-dependent methyltransferase [Gaiellaceae bacterium]
MTDRVARRPHGRKARAVYAADDVHSFTWEPVLDALELRTGDRLLDVGCGGGVFLRRALETGCTATGIDHSIEMVRLARRTTAGAAQIVHGDAHALPFRDGEFTALSCIVAFFFLAEPVSALREFRRVLDFERGRIAVFTTAPELKGTPAAPYPLATRGHFYEDEELERLPRDAGFTYSRVTRPDTGAQLLVARG